MDSGSFDSIRLLRKAEEDTAAKAESSRREGAAIVKGAHERATQILEDVVKEAADEKKAILESSRTKSKGEVDALIADASAQAAKIRSIPLDGGIVSRCLRDFLGEGGV
jgi:vacuolar-type H+-ATPase subunit H